MEGWVTFENGERGRGWVVYIERRMDCKRACVRENRRREGGKAGEETEKGNRREEKGNGR